MPWLISDPMIGASRQHHGQEIMLLWRTEHFKPFRFHVPHATGDKGRRDFSAAFDLRFGDGDIAPQNKPPPLMKSFSRWRPK